MILIIFKFDRKKFPTLGLPVLFFTLILKLSKEQL